MDTNLFTTIQDSSLELLNATSIKIQKTGFKKVLFMNTASRCGFAKQEEKLCTQACQYPDILFILQPSNQFLKQEPLTQEELCTIKHNQPNLFYLKKAPVKGNKASEVYKNLYKLLSKQLLLPLIPWNFTKIYIDFESGVWKRYLPYHSVPFTLRSIQKITPSQ
jgi:glutathione peroxidase